MPKIVDERELRRFGLDDESKRKDIAARWDGVNNYIDFYKGWQETTKSLREKLSERKQLLR